jgi:hypothetical protein
VQRPGSASSDSRRVCEGECDTIQGFELYFEVCFKCGSIADVGAIFVLEVLHLRNKRLFKIAPGCCHSHRRDSLRLISVKSDRLPGTPMLRMKTTILLLWTLRSVSAYEPFTRCLTNFGQFGQSRNVFRAPVVSKRKPTASVSHEGRPSELPGMIM